LKSNCLSLGKKAERKAYAFGTKVASIAIKSNGLLAILFNVLHTHRFSVGVQEKRMVARSGFEPLSPDSESEMIDQFACATDCCYSANATYTTGLKMRSFLAVLSHSDYLCLTAAIAFYSTVIYFIIITMNN